MTLAKIKKAAKTKRIPLRLPHAVRLLDSIDMVQRLNDAAVARRGVAHARNVAIESERLATHAMGPAVQGLASIGDAMRRGEQQMAADFAAAARRTPRPPPPGMTPGSMTQAPATPAHMLRPLVPPTPRGAPPPLGPAPVPTPSAAAKAKAASRHMSAEQKAARNARLKAQRAAAKVALARVGAASAAARGRAASR